MSSLLVTCRDKSRLQKHYVPALRSGGWDEDLVILAPGDAVPSLDGFSGLLVVGGDDVHPRCWDPSEPVHPSAEVDEGRDALEMPLVREAWRLGMPILGICRGEQVLNVALGGSLIQDIASHYGIESERHRSGSADVPLVHHQVRLDSPSRLAALIGMATFGVNSRHHQVVGRIAPELKAVGWSGTGESLIEAIETTDAHRWVFGVQWHPENLIGLEGDDGLVARRIFEGFVRAAKAWQSSR